jgi:hypothetical protein
MLLKQPFIQATAGCQIMPHKKARSKAGFKLVNLKSKYQSCS